MTGGLLFGVRNAPSRVTYLANDFCEAVNYGDVVLKVEYDPTKKKWKNNWVPHGWQHREYRPIPVRLLSKVDQDIVRCVQLQMGDCLL